MATFLMLSALGHNLAHSATLIVGRGRQIASIADAARLAKDGDVVEIAAGTYTGDVAVWLQKSLTIRGLGERPILDAGGKSAEGKAIWVFRNGNFTIENIEFRNTRVPAGNGAGIRFESGRLRVEQCVFRNNQMGLLTGNRSGSELSIRDSLFVDAPHQDSPLPHLIYVGAIAHFDMQGTRVAAGHRGHLLKSRALVSDLRYNLIADPPEGSASYELDFPNGGDVTLVGNLIGQSANSENRTLVSYGAEGATERAHRLRISHNTLVSEGLTPAIFWRIWRSRLGTAPDVTTRNNQLYGVGLADHHLENDESGNRYHPLSADGLKAWSEGKLCPQTDSHDDAGPIEEGLAPLKEFMWPKGTTTLHPGPAMHAGALQCASTP